MAGNRPDEAWRGHASSQPRSIRPAAAQVTRDDDVLARDSNSPGVMYRAVAGAAAGAVATVPMTAVMAAMHQQLPFWQRYRLPPRTITMNILGALGVTKYMDEPARSVATVLGHFGYGAAVGAVYGVVYAPRVRHPVRAGIAFGLAVWAGSYLGWLPAAGVLSPATKHPPQRNAVMVTAHAVFGAVASVLAHRLIRGRGGRSHGREEVQVAGDCVTDGNEYCGPECAKGVSQPPQSSQVPLRAPQM